MDADGKAFEDASKDRTFTLSGKSQFTDTVGNMVLQSKDGTITNLLAGITLQGATEPTTLIPNINNNTTPPLTRFTSKASGNTQSPLVCYIEFASPTTNPENYWHNAPLDTSKSYSDTISWTATETTLPLE
ncbi:hypothetical protein PFZ79_002836 [Enterococcus hirae]|nr:hypothetical protein [Enterococcus hirae]